MSHSSAVLQSLAKLERLEQSDAAQFSKPSLPRLPSTPSATASPNDADVSSMPLTSSRTSLSSGHHSRSGSSHSLAPIRAVSPAARSRSPSRSSMDGADGSEDEEEARLHAQYRLKERLKEKSKDERVSRQERRQRMADQEDGGEEDEEERDTRLTSLVHCTMPPQPVIRTRSLRRPSVMTAAGESELPPVSARAPMGELSILHSQRQRIGASGDTKEQCDDESDAVMTDASAASSSDVGAATPCLRVAKRLQQPTALPQRVQSHSRSDSTSLQSPMSYNFSPSVSSTLTTAAASPAVSIPSITRSVASHCSPYSSIASPYSSSHSFFGSPLPASPGGLLPSVLHSPAAVDSSKLCMSEGRLPAAKFVRR